MYFCCKMNLNTYELKFVTADQVPAWDRLSTSCRSIDDVLKGGVPFNGITEIYGSSGVGKTQLLLQLAIMIQVPESIQCWKNNIQPTDLNGKARGALYISTEDVFPSKRYFQLANYFRQAYNLFEVDFEHNLYISHAADYEQLRRQLSLELPRLLATKDIGLVIIDSIAGLFRSENENSDYTSRGQQIIDIVHTLNILSEQHNFAAICSNQVTCNKNTGKDEPCLGLTWSNNVTYRIEISRYGRNLSRTLKVVFAPDLPNRECSFIITEGGISDK